jgi:hypothetical protein
MCLKGLQMAYNPGDYLSVEQLRAHPRLRRQYRELKLWAAQPTPISQHVITRFINTVHRGLMEEGHHRPAHKLHYIEWAVNAMDVQLRMFNQRLRRAAG